MGEFFRGWKRKVGVVTLLMACVFAGGWLRSEMNDEVVNCAFWETNHAIRSFDGKIQFRRAAPHYGTIFLSWDSIKASHKIEPKQDWEDDEDDDWKNYNILWRTDLVYGFHYGVGTHKKFEARRLELWNIPYWSITITLTALSAFLLIKKPKTSTQKKTSEPIANEGGA